MQTGVVVAWKADRGFGFIRPEGASADIFAHVSQVPRDIELSIGARVSFEAGINGRSGKSEAQNIRLAN